MTDKATALSALASLDDFVWGYWADGKPTFEPWGLREWDVSADTGATWTLDPLEVYNEVVVTYTPFRTGSLLSQQTVQQITIHADPDPTPGITNQYAVSIGGEQQSSALAMNAGFRLLAALGQQRYRGQIRAVHAFEAKPKTGRDAVYEVRPGDCVRIRDFSPEGDSITLRIHDVEYTNAGIVMGVEMPAIVTGLTIPSGGASVAGVAAQRVGASPGYMGPEPVAAPKPEHEFHWKAWPGPGPAPWL